MKKLCSIIVALSTMYAVCASDNVVISHLTGDDAIHEFSNVQKLFVDNEHLSIMLNDGTILVICDVDDLQRISFSDDSMALVNKKTSLESIRLYPNPTSDYIIVDGTLYNQPIKIFSSSGHVVFQTTAHEASTTIQTSGLPEGTYLVQIGNTAYKLIKQ